MRHTIAAFVIVVITDAIALSTPTPAPTENPCNQEALSPFVMWAVGIGCFVAAAVAGYSAFPAETINKHLAQTLSDSVSSSAVENAVAAASDAAKDVATDTLEGAKSLVRAAVCHYFCGCCPCVGTSTPDAPSVDADDVEGVGMAGIQSFPIYQKVDAAFHLGRTMFGEVCVIVLLLTPPKSGCKGGWEYLYYFQAVVGGGTTLLHIVISVSMVYKMRQKAGQDDDQAFFPNSMSNKLYTICTGKKMSARLPDADLTLGGGQGKVTLWTKLCIAATGMALAWGLLTELVSDGAKIYKDATESHWKDIEQTTVLAIGAVVSKLPEIMLYQVIGVVWIIEIWFYLFTTFFSCFCNRMWEEDQEKPCFLSCGWFNRTFMTRETPYRGDAFLKDCICVNFEQQLYRFYAWWYFVAENPMQMVHWKKCLCISYPGICCFHPNCLNPCPGGYFNCCGIFNVQDFRKEYPAADNESATERLIDPDDAEQGQVKNPASSSSAAGYEAPGANA